MLVISTLYVPLKKCLGKMDDSDPTSFILAYVLADVLCLQVSGSFETPSVLIIIGKCSGKCLFARVKLEV